MLVIPADLMITVFSFLQFANAFFPIFFTFLFIVTFVMFRPEQALFAMEVTEYFLPAAVIVFGITRLFFDEATFFN